MVRKGETDVSINDMPLINLVRKWCIAHSRICEGLYIATFMALWLAVRLPLLGYHGAFHDLQVFANWGASYDRHPLSFYSSTPSANYSPAISAIYGLLIALYTTLAHAAGHPSVALDVTHSQLLAATLKLPGLAADLCTCVIIYWLARRRWKARIAIVITFAYVLTPTVIAGVVGWGQIDSLASLFAVLAVMASLSGQGVSTGALIAAAALAKPQPAIFLPLLLLVLWRRNGLTVAARALAAFACTTILAFLPYLVQLRELSAYTANLRMNLVPFATDDALNVWWILGRPGYDVWHPTVPVPATAVTGRPGLMADVPLVGPFTPTLIGLALFAAVYTVVVVGLWRSGAQSLDVWRAAFVLAIAFVALATAQHATYIYQAVVIAIVGLAASGDHAFALRYVFAALFATFNLGFALLLTVGRAQQAVPEVDLTGAYRVLVAGTGWWLPYSLALAFVVAMLIEVVGFTWAKWRPAIGQDSEYTPSSDTQTQSHMS